MASQVLSHLCAFLTLISGVAAWRCAKYRHYFSQQPDYIDCFWDCCGNSFNRHCCAPIGIIVGCAILGAVLVAALTVVFVCCWQRRRARRTKGPKLFHNRRHSHYPVAPTSVTRPAPQLSQGPPPHRAGYPPMGGPPPQRGGYPRYEPRPTQGYQMPPEQYDDSDREKTFQGRPVAPYLDEKPPLSSDTESDRGVIRLQEKRPPDQFFM